MMGEGEVRRRQGVRAVRDFLMGFAMVRLEMDENILGFYLLCMYGRGGC